MSRMIDSQPESGDVDPRREAARTNIYLAADLVSEKSHIPVTVRNLSSTGALIQSRVSLDEELQVTLARGSLRAKGTLVWKEGRFGGIAFAEPINLAIWIPGYSNRGQANVDRLVAESRGHVVPIATIGEPCPPLMTIVGLTGRIAEELAFVSRKLEALGSDLADDPTILVRHATKLQDLDFTTQVLGHLIRLLNSAQPEAVLPTIGMEDLRRRLERATLPSLASR